MSEPISDQGLTVRKPADVFEMELWRSEITRQLSQWVYDTEVSAQADAAGWFGFTATRRPDSFNLRTLLNEPMVRGRVALCISRDGRPEVWWELPAQEHIAQPQANYGGYAPVVVDLLLSRA